MAVKVLASCGAGIGSSMIIKRKIQKIFDNLNIPVEITHASIGSAKSEVNKYDIVFTLAGLVDNFAHADESTTVVGLKNIMSEQEIEAAVKRILKL